MRLKQQYQELLRLKEEINQRLVSGTDFQNIKELMLYLAKDQAYYKLKFTENQLIMLESFFCIWLKEKRKLPDLGIETDIFSKVSCLDDVEKKYQKIKFCGLRIENTVPEEYIEQAVQWLIENEVSGLAIGKIITSETKDRVKNLLGIAQHLRKREEFFNALLLLQYANEAFPGKEKLLLEEADIWFDIGQFDKAFELLGKIEKPSKEIKELIAELQQVKRNG